MSNDQTMMDGKMGEAAGALNETNPNEQENTSEQQGEESFFIPSDILGGKKYKTGDKITLEVMGEDEDGDLEVCFPGAGGSWHDELRTELNQAGSE